MTTTVASLAAQVAATQSKVIVSVEDTTEYILPQGRGLVCAAGDRSGLRFQGGSPCDGAAAGCRCDPSGWNRE